MAGEPQDERQRLASLYAGLTEGELLKLAAEQDELSDTAYDVLFDEIERRGLSESLPPTAPSKPEFRAEQRNLVMIKRFRDLNEAFLAKGMLESAAIPCFLRDDNMVRMDWLQSNFFGGAKLMVDAENAEAALEILNQPQPQNFEVPDVGEFEQPACPRCGSRNITYQELNKELAFASVWLVPIPFRKNAWKCEACGAEWREEPDEPEDSADTENPETSEN
jgi:hypothetical protein